jgi:hypothetical protein
MEPDMKTTSKLWLLVFSALAALGSGACADEPELIFNFSESTHGVVITPSVDVASVSQNQIAFVGQLNTPRPCYRLVADADVSDGQITLTVTSRQNQSQTCEQIVGQFLYEGGLNGLDAGTYQVRIRHRFDNADWPDQEFNLSVPVR